MSIHDSEEYPVYSGLWRSFYDPLFYRHVGRNWEGKGFVYLLLMVAVTVTPMVLMLYGLLQAVMEKEGEHIIDQFPLLTIENERVSISEPQPYIITTTEGKPAVVIDTTGHYQQPEDADAVVLITEKELITSEEKGRGRRSFSMVDSGDALIDQTLLRDLKDTLMRWFLVVMIPISIGLMFLMRALQALIYSVCGVMLAGMLKVKIGFSAITQIAMVAITPGVVLGMIIDMTGITIGYNGLMVFLISLGYMAFGMKSAGEPIDS